MVYMCKIQNNASVYLFETQIYSGVFFAVKKEIKLNILFIN